MLSFDTLRVANMRRVGKFKTRDGKPAHVRSDGSDWDFSMWLMATIGELGELAEVRLKYEHGLITRDQYEKDVANELADVVTYMDLMAMRALDEPTDELQPMGESTIIMHITASLGLIANAAKKFVRGDLNKGDYLDLKESMMDRLLSQVRALSISRGNQPKAPLVGAHGVNLGEAVYRKFNEVSARVKAGVTIMADRITVQSDR